MPAMYAAQSPIVTALMVLLLAFITGALLLGWIRAERADRHHRREAAALAHERAGAVCDLDDPAQWQLEVRAQYGAARAEQIRHNP